MHRRLAVAPWPHKSVHIDQTFMGLYSLVITTKPSAIETPSLLTSKARLLLFSSLLALAVPSHTAIAQDIDKIDMSADVLSYDKNTHIVVAEGRVIVVSEGYILNAPKVTYNEQTGVVHASGGIRITDPNGNTMTLDEAQLDDKLRDGFIENVRMMMGDGARLAAKNGHRHAGRISTLNNAVYSPCRDVCVRGTTPQDPLWQVKAERITHDQKKKRLTYQNATLEMMGLPVLYLPYLSHPDPTVKRATGLLTPEFFQKRELGVSVKLPYHIVMSPSSDITLTPILTSKEGLVLAGEYRKRISVGQFDLQSSATYTDARDNLNVKTGKKEFRTHIFSKGQFTHNDTWRSSYRVQLSSDDTYLRRYGFSDLDTLTNEYMAEGFFDRSYASVQSIFFQGLRIEDDFGTNAIALPFIQYDYVGDPGQKGDVVRANANFVALTRFDGIDTSRLSMNSSWELPLRTRDGLEARLGAHMRGDIYQITDASKPDNPVFGGENGITARALPNLTARLRWPFAKSTTNTQQILEPLVDLIIAPDGGNPSAITNEDSRTFELTDTNIFAANRFPGIDRWEGGTRLNYGVKWSLFMGSISSEVVLGQSYRVESNSVIFPKGSGLSGNFSDLVGRWDTKLSKSMGIAHRFRLDKDTLRVRRNEIDVQYGADEGGVNIGYFQLNRNRQEEGLDDREEIRMGAYFKPKNNWMIFGDVIQNLTSGSDPVSHRLGLKYQNECLEFRLSWRKSYTEDRDIVPGSSINFSIRLKHLG